MNIVLVGSRGSGKSIVAKCLSRMLGMAVISTDELIVTREGQSIPDIVRNAGWDYFRDVEAAVVADVARHDHVIVDTGGGAVLRPENRTALKKSGIVVWLKAEPTTIAARIKNDDNRPALTPGKTFLEEIAEVLEQRRQVYQEIADIQIQTDEKTPEEIAAEIARHVPNHGRMQST
ncbi:MAG: shikimate kinase [Desulfobacterota bacterium]|nr:shikimate kinase [Thermodesulfobacteriota bacterium]